FVAALFHQSRQSPMNIGLCPTSQGIWNFGIGASSEPFDRAGCGVGIDEQRPAFLFKGEAMCKVDSNRCFTDAAFLVSYRNNLCHIRYRIKSAQIMGVLL